MTRAQITSKLNPVKTIKRSRKKQTAAFWAVQFNGKNFKEFIKWRPYVSKSVFRNRPILILNYGGTLQIIKINEWLIWYENNTCEIMDDFKFNLFCEEVIE